MKRLLMIFICRMRRNGKFTHQEVIKIKYALESLVNDLYKFLIILIAAAVFDFMGIFLLSTIALLSVRIFSGGIHLDSGRKCFLFTAAFFTGLFILVSYIEISPGPASIAGALLCTLAIFIFSPAPNPYRCERRKEQLFHFKLIATGITALWFIVLFVAVRSMTYFSAVYLTLAFQSIQLAFSYRVMKYEKKGKVRKNEKIYEMS